MSASSERNVANPLELLARTLRCHLCRWSLAPVEAVGPDVDGDWYCADYAACNKRCRARFYTARR